MTKYIGRMTSVMTRGYTERAIATIVGVLRQCMTMGYAIAVTIGTNETWSQETTKIITTFFN
jgi:hypothetical protein